jgi:hypothetical protein
MVARHHQHQRARRAGQCGQRDCGRGVAAGGLENQAGGRDADVTELLLDERRMAPIATMTGASNLAASAVRKAVSWSIVWGSVRLSSCLGRSARDSGHSRVPDPPDRMMGVMRRLLFI